MKLHKRLRDLRALRGEILPTLGAAERLTHCRTFDTAEKHRQQSQFALPMSDRL